MPSLSSVASVLGLGLILLFAGNIAAAAVGLPSVGVSVEREEAAAEADVGPDMPTDDPAAPVITPEFADALAKIDISEIVDPTKTEYGVFDGTITRNVGGGWIRMHFHLPWGAGYGPKVAFPVIPTTDPDTHERVGYQYPGGEVPPAGTLLEITTSYGCSFLYGADIGHLKWKPGTYSGPKGNNWGQWYLNHWGKEWAWGQTKPCMMLQNYNSIPVAPSIPTVSGSVTVEKDRWWTMVETDVFGELWSRYLVEVINFMKENESAFSKVNVPCPPDYKRYCSLTSTDEWKLLVDTKYFDSTRYFAWLEGYYNEWGADASGVTYSKANVAGSCGGVWLPYAAPWGCLVRRMRLTTDIYYTPWTAQWGSPAFRDPGALQTVRHAETDLWGNPSFLDIEWADMAADYFTKVCDRPCTPSPPKVECLANPNVSGERAWVPCVVGNLHPELHAYVFVGAPSSDFPDSRYTFGHNSDAGCLIGGEVSSGIDCQIPYESYFVTFRKVRYFTPGEERGVDWTDSAIDVFKEYINRDSVSLLQAYWFAKGWIEGKTPFNTPQEAIADFESVWSSRDVSTVNLGDPGIAGCKLLVDLGFADGTLDYQIVAGKHPSDRYEAEKHCPYGCQTVAGRYIASDPSTYKEKYDPMRDFDNPDYIYPTCLPEILQTAQRVQSSPNSWPLMVVPTAQGTWVSVGLRQSALLPVGYGGVTEIWIDNIWVLIFIFGVGLLIGSLLLRRKRRRF